MTRTVLIESLPPEWNAWSSLRPFLNVEWVEEQLIRKHQIPPRYHRFAKKQAEQLKYCLRQAQEYWQAAQSASTATKPLQIYYCCMSLALAEILWRGSGEVAIDVVRETHGHHGLKFRCALPALPIEALTELVAKPHIGREGRTGTFELWHAHTREGYIVGRTDDHRRGHLTSVEVLFGPSDVRLPVLPDGGVSIDQILSAHPRMAHALASMGRASTTLRATIRREIRNSEIEGFDHVTRSNVIVHPARPSDLQSLQEAIAFSPGSIPDVDFEEYPTGFRVTHKTYETRHCTSGMCRLPAGISLSASTTYFSPNLPFLNEFGMFYVGSFVLGMLCRYYPDLWMKEIEQCTGIFHLATEFLQVASNRIPLLTLSVLSDTVYVRNDVGLSV